MGTGQLLLGPTATGDGEWPGPGAVYLSAAAAITQRHRRNLILSDVGGQRPGPRHPGATLPLKLWGALLVSSRFWGLPVTLGL